MRLKNISIISIAIGFYLLAFTAVMAGQSEFDNLRNGMGADPKNSTVKTDSNDLSYIEQTIKIDRDIVNKNPGGTFTSVVDLAAMIKFEEEGFKITFTQRAYFETQSISFTAEITDNKGNRQPIRIIGSESPSKARDPYQGNRSRRSATGSEGRTNGVDWDFKVYPEKTFGESIFVAIFGIPGFIQADIDNAIALIERALRNKIIYTQGSGAKIKLPQDKKTGSIRTPSNQKERQIAVNIKSKSKTSEMVLSGFPNQASLIDGTGHFNENGDLVVYVVPGENKFGLSQPYLTPTPQKISWETEINGKSFDGVVGVATKAKAGAVSSVDANPLYSWRKGQKTPDVIAALSGFINSSSYKTVLNSYLIELNKLRGASNSDKIYGLGVLNTRLSREGSLSASFKNSATELFRYGTNILYGNTEVASCVSGGKASKTTINLCNEQGGAVYEPSCTSPGAGKLSLKTFFAPQKAWAQTPEKPKELNPNPFHETNQRDPQTSSEKILIKALEQSGIADKAHVINTHDCDNFAMEFIDYLRETGSKYSDSETYSLSVSDFWRHAFVDYHQLVDGKVTSVIFIDPKSKKIYTQTPADTISILDDPKTPKFDEIREYLNEEEKREAGLEADRRKKEEAVKRVNEANEKVGKKTRYIVTHDPRNSLYSTEEATITTETVKLELPPTPPSVTIPTPTQQPTTPTTGGLQRPILGPH